ncbi:MAG: murein L,D-transpeptidase [Rhizobiales bacterium]|nr:murein L,D-transpeptidase [Hyphomicrobiales bacterium]
MSLKRSIKFKQIGFAATFGLLASCSQEMPKHMEPLSYQLRTAMGMRGMTQDAPIMLRIFKQESQLEVWKMSETGRYAQLASYPVCQWSGVLGPKLQEGDRQAPEGFYPVSQGQMNPWSSYYLSFNMGFPNRFDRALGRTGSNLMIHGACSSAGCYSMTDDIIADIYSLAREAFIGGQEAFQIQAFPFRMTQENMEIHQEHPDFAFWQNLKIGYDAFNATGFPPKVTVCGGTYVFNTEFDVPEERIDARRPCPTGRSINFTNWDQMTGESVPPVPTGPQPQYIPTGNQQTSLEVPGQVYTILIGSIS